VAVATQAQDFWSGYTQPVVDYKHLEKLLDRTQASYDLKYSKIKSNMKAMALHQISFTYELPTLNTAIQYYKGTY
jgi:hypothetical protein